MGWGWGVRDSQNERSLYLHKCSHYLHSFIIFRSSIIVTSFVILISMIKYTSAKARRFYSIYSELQVVLGKLETVFMIPNCQVWLKLSVLNITDNIGFKPES